MTWSARRVRALVAKDFLLYGRDIALTQLGLSLFIAAMIYAVPSETSATAAFVFNVNMLLAAFWSEWLISREKTKGTFAWLRACPIDDRELGLAKFAAVAVCTVLFWTITSLLFSGSYWWPARAGAWGALLIALLGFGALTVATRWRFGAKAGQLLPFALVAAVLLVLTVASRMGHTLPFDPEVLLRHGPGRLLLAAVAAVVYAAIVWWTVRWVRQADTAELLE